MSEIQMSNDKFQMPNEFQNPNVKQFFIIFT